MTLTVTLTLLGRTYCHLCDDMQAALKPYRERYGFDLNVLDVDTDLELERVHGEKVPVLLLGAHEICHYYLDVDALTEALEQDRSAIR